MRAWAVIETGKPLQEIELPTPEPTGKQVLLEITHAGVCHSDLHIWEGEYDLGSRGKMRLTDRGVTLPLAMGHEIVGRVLKWGPEANNAGLKVGDHMIVFPWVGCGKCAKCLADEDNMCLTPRSLGVYQNGGYATHVLAPEPATWSRSAASTRPLRRPMRARASRCSAPSTRSCRWTRTTRSCWSVPEGSG